MASGFHAVTVEKNYEFANRWRDEEIVTEETENKEEEEEIVCHCGGHCWARLLKDQTPCGGKLGVSEDSPGSYIHYCEVHGHPDDQ